MMNDSKIEPSLSKIEDLGQRVGELETKVFSLSASTQTQIIKISNDFQDRLSMLENSKDQGSDYLKLEEVKRMIANEGYTIKISQERAVSDAKDNLIEQMKETQTQTL